MFRMIRTTDQLEITDHSRVIGIFKTKFLWTIFTTIVFPERTVGDAVDKSLGQSRLRRKSAPQEFGATSLTGRLITLIDDSTAWALSEDS
jgi:hypothetical protein